MIFRQTKAVKINHHQTYTIKKLKKVLLAEKKLQMLEMWI